MGITAIAGVASSLLSRLESLHHSKASKTSSAPLAQSISGKDASNVSDPGMLFTQLQNLSQHNPAEFKKIAAQVSQQLQAAGASAAKNFAGSPEANVLNQMASNFQNASKTGSFSDLFAHASSTPNNATSGAVHQQYTDSSGGSHAGTIHNIFSQALAQIKTDLSGSATLNSASF